MLLWKSIAFGPIYSRRLGQSLGINLLQTNQKICTFDCLYCECGWTEEKEMINVSYYTCTDILQAIEIKLRDCRKNNIAIDSITFSGNGEPTLHPQFSEIVEGLLQLRARYYPNTVITCLSNATQLYRAEVREALQKIENPMLKLDAGDEFYFQLINAPIIEIKLADIVHYLSDFHDNLIIQTLFFKGIVKEIYFDNSSEPHFSSWLHHIQNIKPQKVIIYSLDRATPANQLVGISGTELEILAEKIRKLGIETATYGR